jgi:hypothetical protein
VRRAEAYRRVEAALDQVLARSGRLASRPDLRVVRSGPESYRRRDGSCRIDIPLRYARDRSDAALLASVAHEVAHIEYGDLEPPGVEVRPLLLLAVLVISGGVLGAVWGPGLTSSGAALGALVFIVVMLVRRTLRNDAAGRSLPREELRADLRAAQLVGRDAVLEMLSLRREPGWFVRSVNRLAPTHPPGELRRAAVRAYDVLADPGVVAEQHL